MASNPPAKLERLDASLPFVAAVQRAVAGEGDDSSLVLRAFMERHGVYVIHQFAGLDLDIQFDRFGELRAPTQPLRLSALLRLGARLGGPPLEGDEDDADGVDLLQGVDYVPYERERLFPFLSETQLLIDGSSFSNDHCLVFTKPGFADPLVEAFGSWYSMRGWGTTLAEWAEWAGWVHQSGRPLTYVDFYIGDCGGLPDHVPFQRGALAAIATVTRQLCAEAGFSPDRRG
ncbi:MAG: hypothetical protein KC457_18615 [Myxococcales bacterium]|nr:hypothetical protein [Myxococcales bacterium]